LSRSADIGPWWPDCYVQALLDQPPPAAYANWTAPLLPRELVDIHEQYLWRFLRAQKIDLSRRKSCVCASPGQI
jgi:hypothetical protein